MYSRNFARPAVSQKEQPFVVARRRQSPDQIVDPRVDQFVKILLRLRHAPGQEFPRRHSRLSGERDAEQKEVDQCVFIAAPQSRAHRGVLRPDPRGPRGRLLLRRFALQFGRENIVEQLQQWARVFII
jgi:hypothetical protein